MTSQSGLERRDMSIRAFRPARSVPPAAALLGIVGMVAGSFLPWILSGRNAKNSYEIAGAAERYLPDGNKILSSALTLWPWQGPVWAVVAVVYLLGLRRSAAAAAVVFALLLGAIAGGVLFVGSRMGNTWITVHSAGPVVTLVGAVITVLAAGMITLRRQNRRIEVFPPQEQPS